MKISLKSTFQLLLNILLFCLSIIVLVLPAIINRYPLLFSDTGTYIYSGFAEFIPKDRPIFYGIFVRHISLAESLWFVVIAQAILVYFVVYSFVKSFFSNYALLTFILILLLYLVTGICEYTCQIMPDIFLGLSLIIFLIAIIRKFSIAESIILGLILAWTSLFHYSNIIVNTGFFIFFLAVCWLLRSKIEVNKINLYTICIAIAISWITIPIVNKSLSKDASMAKYKSIILSGKYIENGIMTKFLLENCTKKNYALCSDIEKLKTIKLSPEFVWLNESPLYKNCDLKKGEEECWKIMSPKLDTIINDMFHDRSYQKLILLDAIEMSGKQLITINLKTFPPMVEGSPVHYPIKAYLKNDYSLYKNAKQGSTTISFKNKNKIINLFYLLSFVGTILIISFFRSDSRHVFVIMLIGISVFFIINAAVCANLSAVVGRYQGRIEWVLVLLFLLVVTYSVKPFSKYFKT